MWLNERSFFMISCLYDTHLNQLAVTTRKESKDTDESKILTVGSTTSSLQKVQENNRDIGLFVFGDISVREEGQFRLRFDLFEYM